MEVAQKMERLRQLRRVVQAAPARQFKMNDIQCGTAMCAAGWAAIDPWFVARGLRLIPGDGRHSPARVETETIRFTFPALAEFFGLDEEDADTLFAADATRSTGRIPKRDVITNIDRILKGHSPAKYRAILLEERNL